MTKTRLVKYFLLLVFAAFPEFYLFAKPIDSPDQCLSTRTFPCSLTNSDGIVKLDLGFVNIYLDSQTVVEFTSEHELKIHLGKIWMNSSKDFKIILSNNIRLNLEGEWLIDKNKNQKAVVRNLGGRIRFDSDLLFQNETIPVGFENWFVSKMSKIGMARGIPRPIEVEDFIKSWSQLSGFSAAEIKNSLMVYKKRWKDAPMQASQFYQEVANRIVASESETKKVKKAQIIIRTKEQEAFRKIYRSKNGLEGPEAFQ